MKKISGFRLFLQKLGKEVVWLFIILIFSTPFLVVLNISLLFSAIIIAIFFYLVKKIRVAAIQGLEEYGKFYKTHLIEQRNFLNQL